MSYTNGIIRCPDPHIMSASRRRHGLSRDDHIRWIVDHAPPLTAGQCDQLAMLLRPPGPGR